MFDSIDKNSIDTRISFAELSATKGNNVAFSENEFLLFRAVWLPQRDFVLVLVTIDGEPLCHTPSVSLFTLCPV